MASNERKILDFYNSYAEDRRASESKYNALEFHYTKKLLGRYITPSSHVIEVGCGTGYYGMLFADLCCQYTGVDISPSNIAILEEKITAEKKFNVKAMVGDATNLSGFSDSSFDIVLCLGPMYHLPIEERQKAFYECYRIARPGAILAFAYINRLGAYVGACMKDEWRSQYPNAKANQAVLNDSTDDVLPDVFYYTSPEEMETIARQGDLSVVKNCGLDFSFSESAVNGMDGEQFRCYMELADKMSESPSCTGLANRALLICQK